MFNTEDLAHAVETEQPALRHWLRKAQEARYDIGDYGYGPHSSFDYHDVAVIALVRALVHAGLDVNSAWGFAIHLIAQFGNADSDQPPEDLWSVWKGHELFLVNRHGQWGIHDVAAHDGAKALPDKPDEELYLAFNPQKIIRGAFDRALESRERRKELLLERKFG